MKNAVCTLFEKHYHYGAIALANSLIRNGFTGDIYNGYRGDMPFWGTNAKPNPDLNWEGGSTMKMGDKVNIHFLPMATDAHFTNYKAHFMIELWDGPAKDADNMFYFDPDIVFAAEWSYFERWVTCGVALCEDVNSPVYENNPRRIGWRNYFKEFGHTLKMKEPLYCNAGFMGVNKADRGMVEKWKQMMDDIAPRIGGLNRSNVSGLSIPKEELGTFAIFGQPDQDVMNAAVEAYEGKISFAGKEGMSFIPAVPLIPHALGKVKPWIIKPFSEIAKGMKPRAVDKIYWNYVDFPIRGFSNFKIKRMQIALKTTALISRFYARS